MKLTDLLPIEKWEELERTLYERSGLNACVYNPESFRITNFVAWANDLCKAIKAAPQGASAICALASQYATKQCKDTGKPAIIECDAGLVKFAIPIFWNNEFLGTAGGCGYRYEDGEVDTFFVHKIINRDLEELDAMAAKIKIISEEEVNEYIKLLEDKLSSLLKERD